ncbi:MAG: CCA tRNA nucleotidyltransferase [Oscillospiraceae bacterium]|nr:CCA tRNA nucleotidyltransferase [Oscillospiraceae bacterium]
MDTPPIPIRCARLPGARYAAIGQTISLFIRITPIIEQYNLFPLGKQEKKKSLLFFRFASTIQKRVQEGGSPVERRPDHILLRLKEAGFSAWFVGGCVRDTLLGRPIHDWDITTSALPEEIMEVFPRCVPTGIRHGTVTVLDGENAYEVTTFRVDGDYRDGRHPESVRFVAAVEDDLARRDFTVNAMAMDETGAVLDVFGGKEDLAAKLLRCVGVPEERFREDALRMLRALRFSAQLGFTIEEETYRAIRSCAQLSAGLSAERVRDEVEKTLLSDDPEKVYEMAKLGLLAEFGIADGEDKPSPAELPKLREVRWAGFFRAWPQASWERFKLDKKCGRTAQESAALYLPKRDRLAWKRLISRHGEAVARCTAALSGEREAVEEILQSGECLYLKDLAVGGKDVRGVEGKQVGAVLEQLLAHVLEHPEDNTREKLLAMVQG